MQMIYLLHATFDEELMGRLRRTLKRGFREPGRSDGERAARNDNANTFDLELTEDDLVADLDVGRAA
ncbi:MAG: hypothetical protein AAF997_00790 [Myxococcota bacterium]